MAISPVCRLSENRAKHRIDALCRHRNALLSPPSGTGQAIIFSSCGFFYLSSSSFFFPRLFSAVAYWMSTYTWCGLSASLKCRSDVLRAARWKYRTQKIAKNSPSAHHRTTLSGCIFDIKAHIDNRKNLSNSNTLSTCLRNMVNVGPLTAEICSLVWGAPANFNWFRVLASLLQQRRSPNFARCLAVSWAGTLYIYFRELLPPNGILPGAKFTLRPSLALSYTCSVTARHSSSVRQPNFASWYLHATGRPCRSTLGGRTV